MIEARPGDLAGAGLWLADRHPVLWRQLGEIDSALSRLEQERAPEPIYREKFSELVSLCQEAQALQQGTWGAMLVNSTLLGCEVWVVTDEDALTLVRGDTRPVFFAEEVPLLRGKPFEESQTILKAKETFPGCRVIQ